VKDLVNKMGKSIATGEYPVGENIPMEPELVAQFDVSRTVVREAVKVLSGKGLVKTARRYGTRVCPYEDWNLLDPDVINWHDPASQAADRLFVDVSQFRYVIEPEAAALAAVNASDSQRELIVQASKAIHNHGEYNLCVVGADYHFHCGILDATQSLVLKQFRGLVHAILVLAYEKRYTESSSFAQSKIDHLATAEAIANGDAELARESMRRMLDSNLSMAARCLN
jgi:DNA-binding FadR family transcriptional regulator